VSESKKGFLEARLGQPLFFKEEPSDDSGTEQKRTFAPTLRAYRDAAVDLLRGKYQDLGMFAPTHLAKPGNITAIHCNDGLIVRYDIPGEEESKVRSLRVQGTLAEVTPKLSDNVIHFPADPSNYHPGPEGPTLQLSKFQLDDPSVQEPIVTFRPFVFAKASLPAGFRLPGPPHKPPCLISMTNELHMSMEGVVEPTDPQPQGAMNQGRGFIAASRFTLRVGWQAIEIYPLVDLSYWRPDYATLWAETDLLAAVARRQFADAQFAALDPNVTARKTFQRIFEQFTALLDGAEEPLHQFLKGHPELLCPTHTKFWSKLPFGDRVSDFVFRQPGNEYLLVEIESPLRELFRKDGQQREELTHAFNQILDWRVYIEDHLQDVQQRMGLIGISPNPSSLIVIGRSSSLTEANRRKLTALQAQIPKLRILTYEELLQSAQALAENLFGPLALTGQNVDIHYVPISS
jgi:hypothetical protein